MIRDEWEMSPTALLNVVKGHRLRWGVDGPAAGGLSVRVAEPSPALSFWTVMHWWRMKPLAHPPEKHVMKQSRSRYQTIYQDINQEFVYIYCHMYFSSVW